MQTRKKIYHALYEKLKVKLSEISCKIFENFSRVFQIAMGAKIGAVPRTWVWPAEVLQYIRALISGNEAAKHDRQYENRKDVYFC